MRRSVVTGAVALVAAGLSVGCASARIRKANEVLLARADTRVLDGCYECLRDARDIYARLSTDKNAPPVPKGAPSITTRLFETELLLALREKELALDSRGSLERARAMAPRVPQSLEPQRIIAIADAVLPDGPGTPVKAMDALQERHKPYVDKIDGDLTWIETAPLTPEVRKYIALSLDCSYATRRRPPGDTVNTLAKRREVPLNAAPLVAYRAADCAKTDTLSLKRTLYANPSFAEAAYALGALTVIFAGETGGDDARAQLDTAYAHFPNAPGVTYLQGYLNSLLGDCGTAVGRYEQTLAIEPVHDRAMLQMAICQTNLQLDSAAIATATRFIALETPNVAEGYYWRASNRLRRKELELARSDIEAAKARTKIDGAVLTLAGIIEHEQNDLAVAERDLKGARGAFQGDGNCSAAFYLGSVFTKGERWPEAVASFDSAMTCYELRAHMVASKIAEVRASSRGTPAFRAKRIAILEEELADRRRRYYTATYNVASVSARMGNIPRAEELLVIASQSPALTAQVATLRGMIADAERQAQSAAKSRAARSQTPRR